MTMNLYFYGNNQSIKAVTVCPNERESLLLESGLGIFINFLRFNTIYMVIK
jgi:hypothetical protein